MFIYTYNNPTNLSDPTGFNPSYSSYLIMFSKQNRKKGKTAPKSWPSLPSNLAGKNPKWNPLGYWEGKKGKYTWDNKSHGAGVNRGAGEQDGHWDDEDSNNRWDRKGNLLPIASRPISRNANYGLAAGAAIYLIISEGSRIIPIRNLIPIP
jgi:hypothetical protein